MQVIKKLPYIQFIIGLLAIVTFILATFHVLPFVLTVFFIAFLNFTFAFGAFYKQLYHSFVLGIMLGFAFLIVGMVLIK